MFCYCYLTSDTET